MPLSDLAKKVSGAIYTNIIIVGIFAALFEIDRKVTDDLLNKAFQGKGEKVVEKNIAAINAGYELGRELLSKEIIKIELNKDSENIFYCPAVEKDISLGLCWEFCFAGIGGPIDTYNDLLDFINTSWSLSFGCCYEQVRCSY